MGLSSGFTRVKAKAQARRACPVGSTVLHRRDTQWRKMERALVRRMRAGRGYGAARRSTAAPCHPTPGGRFQIRARALSLSRWPAKPAARRADLGPGGGGSPVIAVRKVRVSPRPRIAGSTYPCRSASRAALRVCPCSSAGPSGTGSSSAFSFRNFLLATTSCQNSPVDASVVTASPPLTDGGASSGPASPSSPSCPSTSPRVAASSERSLFFRAAAAVNRTSRRILAPTLGHSRGRSPPPPPRRRPPSSSSSSDPEACIAES